MVENEKKITALVVMKDSFKICDKFHCTGAGE